MKVLIPFYLPFDADGVFGAMMKVVINQTKTELSLCSASFFLLSALSTTYLYAG